MSYQILARKYRPQLFSDVIGQDHVTRTLLNALAQNRIAHGYIFSGHRGIGKTTIARILAAALNCTSIVGSPERPTEEPCRVCVNCREISSASRQETSIFEESRSFDVEEIDAATNRGIDDARLLTAKIQTRPTNKSKYKIIILDEAHQITDAAWNALLKTLEEPPDWAIFMFATTQPEDIPQTIRSRCQHFSFHAVKLDDIVSQLRSIANKEGLVVDDAALTLLAEAGDGSMRDALSIMDQAIASAPVASAAPGENAGHPQLEITQIRELMGSVSNAVFEQILEAVHANTSADVLVIVGRLLDAGNGAPQIARQFVRYLRNTIVAKVTNLTPGSDPTGVASDLLQISPEERNRAARSAALFTEEDLSRFLSIMLRTFDDLGYRQEQRFHLELGLLKLVHVQRLVPIEEVLSQLGAKPASMPASKPATPNTPFAATAPPLPKPTGAATVPGAPGPDSRTPDRAATPASVPPPSPFETDRSRKIPSPSLSIQPDPVRPAPATTTGSLALASNASLPSEPHPKGGPQLVVDLSAAAEVPSFALQPSPETSMDPSRETSKDRPTDDLTALQSNLTAALAAVKGQQSASEQLAESTLSLNGNSLQIHTTVSSTMLPAVFNAEAERVLKTTLRNANAGHLKLVLLPAPSTPSSAAKKPKQAVAGSAAELAEKHPIVQQAKRLFSADISNVIDLREKS